FLVDLGFLTSKVDLRQRQADKKHFALDRLNLCSLDSRAGLLKVIARFLGAATARSMDGILPRTAVNLRGRLGTDLVCRFERLQSLRQGLILAVLSPVAAYHPGHAAHDENSGGHCCSPLDPLGHGQTAARPRDRLGV